MSDYIDKITDKDTGDSRIISPAAEDVRVDNENFEGSDLDEVLTEIAEAGSGGYTPPEGGIPKTDLAPAVQQTLDDVANKVDKVTGKGLSSNDYTDTDKAKVNNLKPVATSGSYNDLTDLPAIPTGQVTVTTNGDGTFTIHSGDNDYTINLNHTHENMAKLVVCEESDLPSTLDPATIYAITDSGETEIEKLVIRGLEFVGGGTPSSEPKIVSPIGTKIDFNGESTKTVTVRASNLSEALTIAVTGITASLQTISASDAENGVQLTLTKGQSFESGTLRIYSSSEVDKSWNVIDSQMYQSLAAVKFTKQQYVETDIHPGPTTRLEIDMQFDGTFVTPDGITTDLNFIGGGSDGGKTFSANTDRFNSNYQITIYTETTSTFGQLQFSPSIWGTRSTLIIDLVNLQASFNGVQQSLTAKTTTMPAGMKFGSNSSGSKPFGTNDIILYSLKHYENNVLTHNYLPCTRNGVVGLYDTETGTFISSGTGVSLVPINN